MIFEADGPTLTITIKLDNDEPGDLMTGHTGHKMLDAGVDGMLSCFRNQQSPAGDAWIPLATATRARKGHGVIGVDSGQLVDDIARAGLYEVAPREASWSLLPQRKTFVRGEALTDGTPSQPARPWLGWTDAAQAECRRLLADAQADDARHAAEDLDAIEQAAAAAAEQTGQAVSGAIPVIQSTHKALVNTISRLFSWQHQQEE